MKTYIFKTPLVCNQSCDFCVTNAAFSEKKYIYSTKKFILYCITLRHKGYTHMTIEGGEPTMILNLEDLVTIAQKYGIIVSIISNGFELEYDYIKDLYAHGLRYLTFSIHSSNPAIHDELVGREGSYISVIRSIGYAVSVGLEVSTNSVISHQNQCELGEIIAIGNGLGVKHISFCCLEVNKTIVHDYENKKFLFPDYDVLQQEIKKLEGENIKIDNLPLCIFTLNSLHFSARYKDIQNENTLNITERKTRSEKTKVKTSECGNCMYTSYCDGALPYFDTSKLKAYVK